MNIVKEVTKLMELFINHTHDNFMNLQNKNPEKKTFDFNKMYINDKSNQLKKGFNFVFYEEEKIGSFGVLDIKDLDVKNEKFNKVLELNGGFQVKREYQRNGIGKNVVKKIFQNNDINYILLLAWDKQGSVEFWLKQNGKIIQDKGNGLYSILLSKKINESEFKFTPRRIEGREEERIKKLELLLQQTHIEGDLDLSNSNITSLGNLKSVGGTLNLRNTNITDLGNLKFVGNHFYLTNNKITSLGNLEFIGGSFNLDLESCRNLTSLGNLKSVGATFYIINTNIIDLGNLKSVDSNLIISGTKITSLDNLEYVGGTLDLAGTKITYIDPSITIIGEIRKTDYTFKSIHNTFKNIKEFNEFHQRENLKEEFKFQPRRLEGREEERIKKLKRLLQQVSIEDDLDLQNTNFTSLGNLRYIGGNLDLRDTNITSLGNLESVGGYLCLPGSKVNDLGNLGYVGGGVYLSRTNITYIDPSIIIKAKISKDRNVFRNIEQFNKFYQDKQDL